MLPHTELGIGCKARVLIDEPTSLLNPVMERKFYDGVRAFYTTVTYTIIKKFAFKDDLVDDIAILLPENWATVTPQTVVCIARHFPSAVPADALDRLEEEVLSTTHLHQFLRCQQ